MRVPIVVLGELEGLCKSKDSADRPEHGQMLRENSRAALAWLRDKPQNVKCVTTKGLRKGNRNPGNFCLENDLRTSHISSFRNFYNNNECYCLVTGCNKTKWEK